MFMNYVKPNKGKSIEERRAEVIADNQELWGTQTGSGVSTGASSGASTGTNTGTDDDYRYYHGAYNGKMNKMPDINAERQAERPEESWFRDEDFLPRDDDYKDEAWEKAFIEAFLEESGVKTPRSKKADALNGVPAAKPSVEDFFNHYGKPSFSFEDIIEDYRKSNAALLGGNKFPSQEMILQKENDLPGYRPGSTPRGYLNPASDPRGIAEKYYILEDYYGKPGKNAFENVEKGTMNNLRSVLGEMIGRGAFLINDWFPNYKPANKVLEENEAKEYAKKADEYFDLAREQSRENSKYIDIAEDFSKEAGYNIFGFAAGDVFKGLDVGFKEYERLIEEGVPKEKALLISAAKSGFAFAQEKLLGYGQKWLGNRYLKDGAFYSHIPWSNAPIDNPEIYDTIVPIRLNKKEYGHVMHELMTNITEGEKLKKYVWRPIGDFIYWFRKNDEGNYEIVDRVSIK